MSQDRKNRSDFDGVNPGDKVPAFATESVTPEQTSDADFRRDLEALTESLPDKPLPPGLLAG